MRKTLLIFFLSASLAAEENFVVQVHTGGRFGEQLQGYLQAKWVAFLHQVPLLYTPFSYSEHLALHREETLYDPRAHLYPGRTSKIGISPPLPDMSRYFCYYYQSEEFKDPVFPIEVDWKHPEFRSLALSMIAPQIDLALVDPPENTVNLAIHVREGGGFDRIADLEAKIALAWKVPPLSFYIDALRRMLELFPNSPLYIHLFTDAKDPRAIALRLQEVVPGVRIAYRQENNRHDANVLEDFFSLFRFDALIRSQSQFSLIPSYLHDFAVVCSPGSFSVQGEEVVIDELDLEIDTDQYQLLLYKIF